MTQNQKEQDRRKRSPECFLPSTVTVCSFTHSFLQQVNRCLWSKLSWALMSWGYKAGHVLALLELVVFTAV